VTFRGYLKHFIIDVSLMFGGGGLYTVVNHDATVIAENVIDAVWSEGK